MEGAQSAAPKLTRILVENPNGEDLEFDGELLAETQEHSVGFVQIYRTAGGLYVIRQNHSSRPGIKTVDRVEIAEDIESLARLLGHTSGAKRILAKIGHTPRRWLE